MVKDVNLDATRHLFSYSTGETAVRTYYRGQELFRNKWNAASSHPKNIFKDRTSVAGEWRGVGPGLAQPNANDERETYFTGKIRGCPIENSEKGCCTTWQTRWAQSAVLHQFKPPQQQVKVLELGGGINENNLVPELGNQAVVAVSVVSILLLCTTL